MAGLILPSRLTRQPQQAAALDSGNQISSGIFDVYNGAYPQMLLSSGSPQSLAQGGAIPPAYASFGVGPQFDGTTSLVSRAAAPFATAAEASLLVVAAPTNTSASTRSIFGYGSSANANALLFIGQGASAGQLSFWARSDGGVSQNLQVAAPGWAQGTPAVLVGTRSESQNSQRLYFNGAQLSATTAPALGAITLNRSSVGGLMRASAGLMFPGSVFLAVSWNRALLPAEVAAISENPWQLFKAPQRRIWVAGTASAAQFASAAVSSSTATAALTTAKPLASTATASATVSPSLTTGIALVANAVSSALSSAALATSIRLASAANAVVTASASLGASSTGLSAAAIATASSSASLSTGIALRASAISQVSMQASLSTQIAFSAQALVAVGITADLKTGNDELMPNPRNTYIGLPRTRLLVGERRIRMLQ